MLSGKINLTSIDRAEAMRYLGMGGQMRPEEVMPELMDRCERELLAVLDAKYVWQVFIYREGVIENCAYQIEGEAAKKHLAGCERVILLCATLSGGVDALLRRKRLTGMAEAMIIDAMASSAIETVLDRIEEEIFSLPEMDGNEHTWRFSPGYADLPLSGQKAFLASVNAYRRIGVGCGDSFLMTPMKSVTCLIGLGHDLPQANRKTCALCSLDGRCRFRERGEFCYR